MVYIFTLTKIILSPEWQMFLNTIRTIYRKSIECGTYKSTLNCSQGIVIN